MSESLSSGWVPDKLPDFKNRNLPINIIDSGIASDLLIVSRTAKVPLELVASRFCTLGAFVNKAETETGFDLIQTNRFGEELPLRFKDQKYQSLRQVSNFQSSSSQDLLAGLVVEVDGKSIDLFMEAANRNKITVDEMLKQMFILGLNVTRWQTTGEYSILIRNENKPDRELSKLFDFN